LLTVLGYANGVGVGTVSREDSETAIRATASEAGVEVMAILWDEARSDSLEDRPNLSRIIKQMSAGMVLIVPSISALAEDVLAQELRLRDIRAAGGRILSASLDEREYLSDDAASLAKSSESSVDSGPSGPRPGTDLSD
jgi:resolvase-like protein